MGCIRQRGAGMVLASAVLLAGMGALLALEVAGRSARAQRERITERALAQAAEALLAYAADRPISAAVGPGYLPCPDLDNDGWAEATCGSLSGDVGQEERLGRLPWKTLGLPDLRDGHGERLWYAVSSKHKGLLNCAASRACVDMSPAAALGTITVRDANGTLLHDGRLADPALAQAGGALAVVIAPGPPLERFGASGGGVAQRRDCRPGECDGAGRCLPDPPQRAAHCDPRNFLDAAPGEDNADFIDRSDAPGRARNTNGFIQGPVRARDGRVLVNDRLRVVAYADVMRRVMSRVALEAAHCLRFYGSRPENAGRLPWPEPSCGQGRYYGHVPDTPFEATLDASAGRMLDRWWRAAPRSPEVLAELPAKPEACRIAVAPMDEGPARLQAPGSPVDEGKTPAASQPSWWNGWKAHVFYALSAGVSPIAARPGCASGNCLALVDADGRLLARDKHFAILVRQSSACRGGPVQCDGEGCSRAVAAAPGRDPLEVVLALP